MSEEFHPGLLQQHRGIGVLKLPIDAMRLSGSNVDFELLVLNALLFLLVMWSAVFVS